MQPHDTTPATKTCTKCGETKPLSEFSRAKKSTDGLQYHCKACNRAYHKANRARILDRQHVYRQTNLEHLREYDRNRRNSPEDKAANAERLSRHYRENAEQIKQRAKDWYEVNKGRAAEKRRKWYEENPERYKVYSERRRAHKASAEGVFTLADIQAQYKAQKGRCYYAACGHSKLGDTYHVDHVIPLSRGGSNGPENLVIACPSCNLSKHDKLPSEWSEGGRLL